MREAIHDMIRGVSVFIRQGKFLLMVVRLCIFLHNPEEIPANREIQ